MGILQKLGGGQGFLKAGFQGFQASGKTWTSILLAAGVRRHFGLTGPIAMFDTEGGSEYIVPLVKRETDMDLLGVRSRSLDDLLSMAQECEEAGVAALVVDSVTHIWRDVTASYLAQINVMLARKGKSPRTKLEFQDWNPIKAKFAQWTDFYLNSRMHIVICGRAGFEYDYEENEDGKKELVKTGLKMKTEGEFGFEPSLLVHMERIPNTDGGKVVKGFKHRATVIKDRFGLIDGAECDDPTFDFFLPHVAALVPGAHAPIDTDLKTDLGVGEDGDADWQRERRERVILCEEIQGELTSAYPGQTKEEKAAKVALIAAAFNTKSWTKVETLNSQTLRDGLRLIRSELAKAKPEVQTTAAEEAA